MKQHPAAAGCCFGLRRYSEEAACCRRVKGRFARFFDIGKARLIVLEKMQFYVKMRPNAHVPRNRQLPHFHV